MDKYSNSNDLQKGSNGNLFDRLIDDTLIKKIEKYL